MGEYRILFRYLNRESTETKMSLGGYGYRWGFINTSGDLQIIGGDVQISVGIYKYQWGFTNISEDLRISAGICKYPWGFTNVSGELQMSGIYKCQWC